MLPIYRHYKDHPVVSISYDQRLPLPEMNWVGTVYHGLPRKLFNFCPEPGHYLAFLGRLSPEKRPDLAIELRDNREFLLRLRQKSTAQTAIISQAL